MALNGNTYAHRQNMENIHQDTSIRNSNAIYTVYIRKQEIIPTPPLKADVTNLVEILLELVAYEITNLHRWLIMYKQQMSHKNVNMGHELMNRR